MCQIDLLNDQIQIRVITNERERERDGEKKKKGTRGRATSPSLRVARIPRRSVRSAFGRKKDSDERVCLVPLCNLKRKNVLLFSPFSLSLYLGYQKRISFYASRTLGMMRTLVARGRRRRRRRRRQRSDDDDDDDDALRRRRRLGRPRRGIEKKWPPTTPSRSSGRK